MTRVSPRQRAHVTAGSLHLRRGALIALLSAMCWLMGCETFARPDEDALSFGDMQALNRGISGNWVLREHPDAREVVRDPRSGHIRRLAYWVEDPAGDNQTLLLHFDARGVLQRKDYAGPIIRPPSPEPEEAPAR